MFKEIEIFTTLLVEKNEALFKALNQELLVNIVLKKYRRIGDKMDSLAKVMTSIEYHSKSLIWRILKAHEH